MPSRKESISSYIKKQKALFGYCVVLSCALMWNVFPSVSFKAQSPYGDGFIARSQPLEPYQREVRPNTEKTIVWPSQNYFEDADNDGVYDSYDACPNTPTGVLVDEEGCEVYGALDSYYQ